MDRAIAMLTTLQSKQAKEKYLKDNFDNSFIDKLRLKVPMMLEADKKNGKGGAGAEDNMINDN